MFEDSHEEEGWFREVVVRCCWWYNCVIDPVLKRQTFDREIAEIRTEFLIVKTLRRVLSKFSTGGPYLVGNVSTISPDFRDYFNETLFENHD